MPSWFLKSIDGSDDTLLQRAFVWLFSFVRPQRNAVLVVLGLSLLASGLVLLQPWLTKILIDAGLLAGDYGMLVKIAVAMITVSILGTALSGINRYLHTRLSGRILFGLREDLYCHLQTLSPVFYGRRRVGDILSRIDGDVAEIQRFAVDSLFSAVSSVVGLVGALVLMLALSWELSLIVALLIPLEILWLRWMRRQVEVRARILRERSADLSSFLVETLPAMKFIQSVAQEEREARRLNGLGNRYLGDLLRLQVTEFFTHAVPGLMTSLSRAGAFLIGGYWVIQGQWQLGALIAFSSYLAMAVGPVQSLLGLYVAIQRITVSLRRVAELRMQEPTVTEPDCPANLPNGRADLRLESVAFSYPGRAEPVLRDLDLSIAAGDKIALIGQSGVGKSTLVDLLQRHYDPDTGRVLLGGVDLRDCRPQEVRRQVAVVSQDIVLFRGTLADNVRYAAPQASDAQVLDAVRQAQLGDLLESLSLGLDSPIGERGQQLSGGQRQRIAIARALLQDPSILVLDEATSAVDVDTELFVIKAVDMLFADRTRILISHRASALAGADRAFTLSNGRLSELSALEMANG